MTFCILARHAVQILLFLTCTPASRIEPTTITVSGITKRYRPTERDFEDLVAAHPELFLGEPFTMVGRQMEFAGLRPDLILRDDHGRVAVVELLARALDLEHIYRAVGYRDIVSRAMGTTRIRLIILCTSADERHRSVALHHGIELQTMTHDEIAERAGGCAGDRGKETLRPDRRIITPDTEVRGVRLTARQVLGELRRPAGPLAERRRGGRNRARVRGSREQPTDVIHFWLRSWRSHALDALMLDEIDLRTIANPSMIYCNDLAGAPCIRTEHGFLKELPGIPVQVAVEAPAVLALTTGDALTCLAWLELLQAMQPQHRSDHEVILGWRAAESGDAGGFDPFGYEGHVRGRLRWFRRLWDRYRGETSYDRGRLHADIELLSRLKLLAGIAPGYRAAGLCRTIAIIAGAGSLAATGRSDAHADDAWLTIRFEEIDAGFVVVMRELLSHLLLHHRAAETASESRLWSAWKAPVSRSGALLLAHRLDLERPCPECLSKPTPVGLIHPDALDLAYQYFAYVRLPEEISIPGSIWGA